LQIREVSRPVAAEVNGEKIFLDDVESAYRTYTERISLDNKSINKASLPTKREVLDGAINEILVLQAARNRGIKVSDREVEGRINALRSNFPGLYKTVVRKVGLKKYKAILKNKMLHDKMKSEVLREPTSQTMVTDKELTTWAEDKGQIDNREEFLRMKDTLRTLLREEKEKKLFKSWVEGLRNKSQIQIYMSNWRT